MVRKAAYIFSIFFFCSSEGGGGTYDAASMIACYQIFNEYAKGNSKMNPMQIASRQIFEMDEAYLYLLQSIFNIAPKVINMSIAVQTRQQKEIAK